MLIHANTVGSEKCDNSGELIVRFSRLRSVNVIETDVIESLCTISYWWIL